MLKIRKKYFFIRYKFLPAIKFIRLIFNMSIKFKGIYGIAMSLKNKKHKRA